MSAAKKRAARVWIVRHWATYMASIDCPEDVPDAVAEIWSHESLKIARRLGLDRSFGRQPPHGPEDPFIDGPLK